MSSRNTRLLSFQARIKKIMQTDEEIGKVAAAVPVIICILCKRVRTSRALWDFCMCANLLNRCPCLQTEHTHVCRTNQLHLKGSGQQICASLQVWFWFLTLQEEAVCADVLCKHG